MSVIAFNSSEYWRMARNIQRGKLFLPDQIHLDPALCQFRLADVRNAINKADSCGLVGLKAIEKTSTLELIAKEQPNVAGADLGARAPPFSSSNYIFMLRNRTCNC